MPKLLLNLRLATDDEAHDIRTLLDEHQVDWYETKPGFWGISAGGIWLRDLERAAEVKRVLDAYQAERVVRVRAEQDAVRRDGTAPTFLGELRANPGRMLIQLLAAALLVAITIALPFMLLSR